MTHSATLPGLAAILVLVSLPSAPSATVTTDVASIRATRVWDWTTRVQRLSVAQRDGAEVWRQALFSVERRAAGDRYAQLSVVEEPALLRDLRVLAWWDGDGGNDRWMYIEQFRRPKRMPPLEHDGFFASVYGTLAVLQQLPYVLRETNVPRLETRRTRETLTVIAPTDTPDTAVLELSFVGAVPRLGRIIVRDLRGRTTRRIRLTRYVSIQGIPTPLAVDAETRDAARTQFRFSGVVYDTPVDDEVFGVATFGDAALP